MVRAMSPQRPGCEWQAQAMRHDLDQRFELSDDPERVDFDRVHGWLSGESYWAAGRSADLQRRAHEGSRVYGVYMREGDDAGRQVAFARAVTDGATHAWVCDVFIDTPFRGEGLGTWLVGEVCARLRAEGVGRLLLATRDAHEVYARVGFTPLRAPDMWMELDRRQAAGEAGR